MKEPLHLEELEELASKGGIEILDLLNRKSKAFKSTGVDPEKITSLEAGRLIAENPRIMHRPLFTNGEALVVGFKPEKIEEIL